MATTTPKTKKTTAKAKQVETVEATIYNQQGKSAGTVSLPGVVFGATWNPDLLHQVVLAMQANKRAGTAHTKDRGEVRGGGKKPWKQKGTGRARHGSTRSPIWTGGGVTHGPRNDKDYSQKINKKMRAKALYVALSEKLRNNKVLFIDALTLDEKKTKKGAEIISSLAQIDGMSEFAGTRKNAVYVALFDQDENVVKSLSNLPQVTLGDVRALNPVDVMSYRTIVIVNPTESVGFLAGRIK